MSTIKFGLKDLSVPVLIGKSRHIISQISKNTTPPPLLEQAIAATKAHYPPSKVSPYSQSVMGVVL